MDFGRSHNFKPDFDLDRPKRMLHRGLARPRDRVMSLPNATWPLSQQLKGDRWGPGALGILANGAAEIVGGVENILH